MRKAARGPDCRCALSLSLYACFVPLVMCRARAWVRLPDALVLAGGVLACGPENVFCACSSAICSHYLKIERSVAVSVPQSFVLMLPTYDLTALQGGEQRAAVSVHASAHTWASIGTALLSAYRKAAAAYVLSPLLCFVCLPLL